MNVRAEKRTIHHVHSTADDRSEKKYRFIRYKLPTTHRPARFDREATRSIRLRGVERDHSTTPLDATIGWGGGPMVSEPSDPAYCRFISTRRRRPRFRIERSARMVRHRFTLDAAANARFTRDGPMFGPSIAAPVCYYLTAPPFYPHHAAKNPTTAGCPPCENRRHFLAIATDNRPSGHRDADHLRRFDGDPAG